MHLFQIICTVYKKINDSPSSTMPNEADVAIIYSFNIGYLVFQNYIKFVNRLISRL